MFLVPLHSKTSKVQIKNIKLHIVTDIKVNFNSMFGFRTIIITPFNALGAALVDCTT